MTRKPKPKSAKKWPLCHKCAMAAGGKPTDGAVTVCDGICVECGQERGIAAYTDYSWPNGDKVIWD